MSIRNIPFFNTEKKLTQNYPKFAAVGFYFQGTQKRVRNGLGKRASNVRATEALLFGLYIFHF